MRPRGLRRMECKGSRSFAVKMEWEFRDLLQFPWIPI